MGITFLISGVFPFLWKNLKDKWVLLSRVTTLGKWILAAYSIFVMVAAARLFQSVWVFVLRGNCLDYGQKIGSYVFLSSTIATDLILISKKSRKLVRFGAWVFVSTALAFFTNSSASLVVGKVFDMGFLGVFSIGATLAKAVEQAYGLVSVKTVFPCFGLCSRTPEDIRATAYRLMVSVLLFVVPSLALFWFAHEIIAVLFDHRYSDRLRGSFNCILSECCPTLFQGLEILPWHLVIQRPRLVCHWSILCCFFLVCCSGGICLARWV